MPAKANIDAKLRDLKKEIQEFQTLFPRLAADDCFLAWFLRAYLVEKDEDAAHSTIGTSNDKGIDAVFIDDNAHRAFVLQGKYRQRLNGKAETRNDVLGFVEVGSRLVGDQKLFDQFLVQVDPLVGTKQSLSVSDV